MNPVILSLEPGRNGKILVTDALGRRYEVDPIALGAKVLELMEDPRLPTTRIEKQNEAVGLIASVAKRVSPKHAALVNAVEPIAHHISLSRRRKPA